MTAEAEMRYNRFYREGRWCALTGESSTVSLLTWFERYAFMNGYEDWIGQADYVPWREV